MSLDAHVVTRRGDATVDVALRADEGAVVAVVGPNGAGKTTLVRALAGLQPIEQGRIAIDGEVVDDPVAGTWVPPERRRVGVVFQDHRLFGSMSAIENVAFGLRCRGVRRGPARARAEAWLQRVGIAAEDARRRPGQLSGGEAQRVALARALAIEPSLLLLDEPLSAVDAGARQDLRHLLASELRGHSGSRILITHDPVEAAAIAERLVVIEAGRVTQQGRLAEVTARPRSPWVAQMVGLNLLDATATGASARLRDGTVVATAAHLQGPVFLTIRPNAVTLHRFRPEGSARNVWPGTATELHVLGDRTRVRIEGPVPLVAEVTPASVADLGLSAGGPVWCSVKATDVDTYPA